MVLEWIRSFFCKKHPGLLPLTRGVTGTPSVSVRSSTVTTCLALQASDLYHIIALVNSNRRILPREHRLDSRRKEDIISLESASRHPLGGLQRSIALIPSRRGGVSQ